jgi:ferric-dicitrate binding protein FerR (iron transport regulator)
MKPKRCPRTWEAEALEDGQLAGADKGSFERHLRTCSICQHEVDAHAKVLAIVHHVPRPQTTPLAHRQSRIRLLDRASERRTGTDFSTRQRWLALAAITVLCIVAVSGVWSLLPSERRALPPTAVAHSAPVPLVPVFDVADVNHAVWTRQAEGSVARPVLEDGVAAFHVEPMVAGQRFLLGLPDGELEVRGTRFVVNVHEGRTESVQVTEGIVALRIQGKAERLLRAGDEWSPVAEERAVAVNDLPTHVMKVEPVTPSRPRAAPPLALHGATNAPPLGPAGSSQPVPAAVGRTAAGERYGAAA